MAFTMACVYLMKVAWNGLPQRVTVPYVVINAA